MPVARADDQVGISYRVIGSGPKDILFVHCWGNSSVAYEELLRDFDVTGLRLIVPDLRGTSQSDRPATGYTLERHKKDMFAVAKDAKSVRPVVVGHSMGGQIAMLMASSQPDDIRGQILLMPVPPSGSVLDAATTNLLRNAAGNRDSFRTIYGFGSPNLQGPPLERLLDDAVTVAVPAVQEGFDAWTQASFSSQLSTTKCPSLVVGTDDPFYSLDTQRQQTVAPIPGARLAYVPGCGHWGAVERPREIAAVIQAFMAAIR